MRNTPNLIGVKFGRLTVKARLTPDRHGNIMWACDCDCGGTYNVGGSPLRLGRTRSCGCLRKETVTAQNKTGRNRTHGMTRTLTWSSWSSMMSRCYNPNVKEHSRYGAIGILPCEFIRVTPANLILAIGERPSKDLTLDRIDSALGYTCGQCAECLTKGFKLNVRWATWFQQAANRCPQGTGYIATHKAPCLHN